MSEFDKDIKPGDLITAYHAGFHRVTKVEPRFHTVNDEQIGYGSNGLEYLSLIYYKTVLTKDYKPSNGKKELCCDAGYCKRLNKNEIEQRRNTLISQINNGCDKLLIELKND